MKRQNQPFYHAHLTWVAIGNGMVEYLLLSRVFKCDLMVRGTTKAFGHYQIFNAKRFPVQLFLLLCNLYNYKQWSLPKQKLQETFLANKSIQHLFVYLQSILLWYCFEILHQLKKKRKLEPKIKGFPHKKIWSPKDIELKILYIVFKLAFCHQHSINQNRIPNLVLD